MFLKFSWKIRIIFSQDLPERPKGQDPSGLDGENYQLWSLSGESCPEETIPIRRTSEKDVLRASSVQSFGKKIQRPLRRDSSSDGHEVSFFVTFKWKQRLDSGFLEIEINSF